MKNIFDTDGLLYRALSWVSDVVVTSLLFALCSLPIITCGAALTAAHKVMFHVVRGEAVSVVNTFFSSFRDNFKQATIVWLIYLIAVVAIVLDVIVLTAQFADRSGTTAYVVLAVLSAIILGIVSYMFPLIARYDNTLKRHFIHSSLLLPAKPLRSLGMIVLNILPAALYFANAGFFLRSLIIWPIAGIGLIVFLDQALLKNVYDELEHDRECN